MDHISSWPTVVIREYANAIWFVLSVELLGLIAWRAVIEWRRLRQPSAWSTFWEWRRDTVVAACIAFSVYLTADALSRGWVWRLLKAYNDGKPVDDHGWVPLTACFLAIVSALCSFRVFVPEGYRSAVMAYGVAFAIVVVLIAEAF